jgi:hypothetical protein
MQASADLKIHSQNDKKIEEAKGLVYLKASLTGRGANRG